MKEQMRIGFIAWCICVISLSLFSTCAYALSWEYNLEKALVQAQNSQKPLMVDFYTSWCGWCKKLDQDVYTDKKVRDLAEQFICVKVDGDKYPQVVAQYRVSAYPTIIFLNYEGAVDLQVRGYRPPADFAALMSQVLAKTKKPAGDQGKNITDSFKNMLSGTVKKVTTPDFTLNGILYDPQEPRALVNNAVVKVGDTVDGAEVTMITQKEVELSYEGRAIVLDLDR
jgi:thioredoxin-related protein